MPEGTNLERMPLERLPDRPLASVAIANYNYARFICEAIESVLNQTYQKFEIIICDDGSTDNSCDVIENYARLDSRIKLIRKENGGVASALNAAYAASSGEIICLLDADDTFEPTKTERVVAAFSENRQAGFCIHRIQPVSAAGRNLCAPIPGQLEQGWVAPEVLSAGGGSPRIPSASANSFRREITDQLFPLPAHLRKACDNFLQRIAIFLTEICAIPAPLAKYRLHGENVTGLAVSASGILRNIEDTHAVIEAQREFLTRRLGSEIGSRVRIEDDPNYWTYLMMAYILSVPRPERICAYTPDEILGRLPEGSGKRLWRLLLAAPAAVGRQGLRLGWGPKPWKRYVFPFLRLSGGFGRFF